MAKHWYKVDVIENEKTRTLVGTSELEPGELVKRLAAGEYLVLGELSYRDNQNRIVSWSSWDPRLASVAYVNPRYITTIMPFVDDPRSSQSAAQ